MEARVRLTGELLVETAQGAARAADFPGRQGRLAFARLALSSNPVPRAQLAEVVWLDRLPRSWERDLSAVVSKLRTLLTSIGFDEPVRSAMGCYQLRLGTDVAVDVFDAMRFVEEAEAALARDDLRAAHGAISVAHEHCLRPFLPGEEGAWVDARRAERHELLVRVLDVYVEVDIRRGVFPEGRRMALQLIDLEPYRESSYAALMRLQIAAGDRADALKTYERARTLLIEELGVSPGARLEAAYQEALFADAPAVSGRSLETRPTLPTGTVTLMFTDLVRSTQLAERLGPEKADALRRAHFALLREVVAMHGGHEVKSLGDGLMVAFASAADAVSCAVAIQKAVAQKEHAEPEALAVRIGIHVGEPVLEDGDYFGLCVVIAKRLCDALEGAGILVSDAVRSLTSQARPLENRVELNLKGLTDPTVAWHVA
jgi:class 3 adenylate cyclase